jgi:hypothetical protein
MTFDVTIEVVNRHLLIACRTGPGLVMFIVSIHVGYHLAADIAADFLLMDLEVTGEIAGRPECKIANVALHDE